MVVTPSLVFSEKGLKYNRLFIMGQNCLENYRCKENKIYQHGGGGCQNTEQKSDRIFEDLDYELNIFISLSTTYKNCEMWGVPGHT